MLKLNKWKHLHFMMFLKSPDSLTHLYFPGWTEESHKNLNHDNVQHYDYSLLGCVCRKLLLQKHMLLLSSGYKNVPQISHSSTLIFHLIIHASPLYKAKYRKKYEQTHHFVEPWWGVGWGWLKSGASDISVWVLNQQEGTSYHASEALPADLSGWMWCAYWRNLDSCNM